MKPYLFTLLAGLSIGGVGGALVASHPRQEAILFHYAPEQNLEKIDVGLIDKAERSIDAAFYVLTDVPVIEALAGAAARGVKVRIYRQPPDKEFGGAVANALAELTAMPNIEIRFKSADGPLMHLKTYCVDGETLRAGAANVSASGLKRQDNDLIIIKGPSACAAFEAHFERMWAR